MTQVPSLTVFGSLNPTFPLRAKVFGRSGSGIPSSRALAAWKQSMWEVGWRRWSEKQSPFLGGVEEAFVGSAAMEDGFGKSCGFGGRERDVVA